MEVLFLLVVMQGMYNPIKISDDLFYQNAFQCSRAAYQMNQQVFVAFPTSKRQDLGLLRPEGI
jgi:hypothetical protein